MAFWVSEKLCLSAAILFFFSTIRESLHCLLFCCNNYTEFEIIVPSPSTVQCFLSRLCVVFCNSLSTKHFDAGAVRSSGAPSACQDSLDMMLLECSSLRQVSKMEKDITNGVNDCNMANLQQISSYLDSVTMSD